MRAEGRPRARVRHLPSRSRFRSSRRIAERIRRAVTALEPDLMRAVSVWETDKVVLRQFQAAVRTSDRHDLGSGDAVGIELIVPSGIERVRPIDALAVTADLDHLRAAGKGVAIRMRRAPSDAADPNGARELGLPRFGDVV